MPAVRLGTSLRVFWKLHRVFMRLTGGRLGRVGAFPALLLTTRGRRSGELRDVALNYLDDDGSFVVVASYAGEDRNPAWWMNLKANPEAVVAVGGKRVRVRASELAGERRESVWRRIVERDSSYAEYQGRTKRRLAVVLLERIDHEGASERWKASSS